jgi:hypothetical protein
MLNRPTAGVLPEQYELSRQAPERYALLTAVKQQRALERRQRHPRLVGETVRQAVAIPH